MNDVHFSSLSNEWQTPSFLFKALDKEFKFKLDAASTKDNALCSNFFTKEDNALEKDWHEYETIWCNPPYGRDIGRFIKKAYMESQKGCTVVLLIPARVDTRWWHDYCSKCEVRFIKGRLKFINKSFPLYKADGDFKVSSAPFPSAIVVMNNKEAITKYVTQEF